ncbi:MAG: YbaN family protein [Planctomycetia bacterium]|nr:YbaN family protein [Planctomycetia bacterium]
MKLTLENESLGNHGRASPATGLRRWLYLLLGWFFVGVALLGAILPILPSTPFLLLASWFFVRSKPALRAWLMQLPVFGSMLHDWDQHQAIRSSSKRAAYVLVLCAITGSILMRKMSPPVIVLLCVLGAIGIVVVSRLREVPTLETKRS